MTSNSCNNLFSYKLYWGFCLSIFLDKPLTDTLYNIFFDVSLIVAGKIGKAYFFK